MKIAIMNTLYAPIQVGGAEISVQALAEAFSQKGNEVLVICLGKESANYQLNNVSVKVIKIENGYWPYDLESKSAYQKFLWHFKDASNTKYEVILKDILAEFNPKIFFTNNLSGFSSKAWQISKKLNIKIVHTLRDYYLQCPKSTKFKNNLNCDNNCLSCKTFSYTKKLDARKVDFVVGISKFILKDHKKNGYFKNISSKIIYNGFEIIENKSINKTGNNLVFGYIGQITKSKGIELLLKSFAKIKNQKFKLLIAGNIEGDYLRYLKTINDSNKIEYLGHVKNSLFFENIDVLVVPSLWNEPFGRVVLEAITHNKPVIASNKGGIKELLCNNKGFVFEPEEDELTRLLKKIILDTKFLSNFSFDKNFLEQFSIKKTVEQYLSVFNEVLTNNK